MSKKHPRSVRLFDKDWRLLQLLAEIAGVPTTRLIESMLLTHIEVLTNGLDIENVKDQYAIKVMLGRIVR